MTTPIASLLPHAPPMLLLDELVECGIDSVTAAATIRPDHPFFDHEAGGVPCHVGIELMAQTCGAFAGLRSLAEGKQPVLGFLLGTRNYRCSIRWFREGDQLKVLSTAVYIDGGTGVFDCQILMGSSSVSSARLTVHQPDDSMAVIAPPGQ